MVHTYSGLAKPRFCIPEMRTLWCTSILGRRNPGSAFSERDSNPMVHTQSELAKPRFCIPRARCEPYGAQSLWVGETSVLHSQNEIRTLWPILILGWQNLGFALPERDANHVVRTHSGLAKPRFCIPGTRCEPHGAHSCWVGETSVLHSQTEMRTLWCTLMLGLAKPGFCIPRTRCEPSQSLWVGET